MYVKIDLCTHHAKTKIQRESQGKATSLGLQTSQKGIKQKNQQKGRRGKNEGKKKRKGCSAPKLFNRVPPPAHAILLLHARNIPMRPRARAISLAVPLSLSLPLPLPIPIPIPIAITPAPLLGPIAAVPLVPLVLKPVAAPRRPPAIAALARADVVLARVLLAAPAVVVVRGARGDGFSGALSFALAHVRRFRVLAYVGQFHGVARGRGFAYVADVRWGPVRCPGGHGGAAVVVVVGLEVGDLGCEERGFGGAVDGGW